MIFGILPEYGGLKKYNCYYFENIRSLITFILVFGIIFIPKIVKRITDSSVIENKAKYPALSFEIDGR